MLSCFKSCLTTLIHECVPHNARLSIPRSRWHRTRTCPDNLKEESNSDEEKTCRSTKRKHNFITTRVLILFWFLQSKRERWLERTAMSVSQVFHHISKGNEASMQKQRNKFMTCSRDICLCRNSINLEFSLSWSKKYPRRPSSLATQSTQSDWNRYSLTNLLTLLQVNCQGLTMDADWPYGGTWYKA